MEEILTFTTEYKSACMAILEQEGKWEGYDGWIKKEGISKAGRSTCTAMKTKLMNIESSKDLDEFNLVKIKAQELLKHLKNYLTYCSKNEFTHNRYYVYFLYLDSKEPQIGRGVLIINPKKSISDKNVVFQNVPDGKSSNYKGSSQQFQDRVLFLSLQANDSERNLHIELTYKKPSQDILLGSYSTFENNHIVRGSLVLQLIKKDNQNLIKPLPTLSSFRKNSKEFFKIHKVIRRYLSLQLYNYHKTPEITPTLKGLSEFFMEHNYNEKAYQRFLEIKKPILFISSPNTSLNNEKAKIHEQSIQYITEELKKIRQDIKIESLHKGQTKTLEILRNTRYFVLVIDEVEKASFSLVQLGWALFFCKYIILFYRTGTISDELRYIDSINAMNNITTRNYSIDLADQKPIIVNYLDKFITSDLGN